MRIARLLPRGKGKQRKDRRTFRAHDVLRKIKVPEAYDFDLDHPEVLTDGIPMYANNRLGCSVISGRAHQTVRFEYVEQGKLIKITDAEVEKQYFKETGGTDSGVVLLDSLNSWRRDGWIAGGRRHRIEMFAALDCADRKQVKRAIIGNVGIGVGLRLPATAIDDFVRGRPWRDASSPRSAGHYVYVSGYTKDGLTCITWGAKQHMSWAFFEKYADEAYAITDALDDDNEAVDADAARELLDTLA